MESSRGSEQGNEKFKCSCWGPSSESWFSSCAAGLATCRVTPRGSTKPSGRWPRNGGVGTGQGPSLGEATADLALGGALLSAAEARDGPLRQGAPVLAQKPAAPLTQSEPGSAPTPHKRRGEVRGKRASSALKGVPCQSKVFKGCLHGLVTRGSPAGPCGPQRGCSSLGHGFCSTATC